MKKLVHDNFFEEKSTLSLGAALFIHMALLSVIFIQFVTTQQKMQKRQIKKEAPNIPPPILLYASPSVAAKPSHTQTPGSKAQQKMPTFSKQEMQEAAALAKELKKEPIKETKPKVEPAKKQKTNLIALPKKPTGTQKVSEKQETDSDEIRKRKLTLADLFKTLPHVMEEVNKHSQEGGSDQLVIAQGDMRYYSFLKKFIGHMNQVFGFKGGPGQLERWAQEGKIKKNVGISIVIDRKGNVLKVEFLTRSGYQPFDDLTQETVQEASPFPPVPAQFKEKTVRVELTSAL